MHRRQVTVDRGRFKVHRRQVKVHRRQVKVHRGQLKVHQRQLKVYPETAQGAPETGHGGPGTAQGAPETAPHCMVAPCQQCLWCTMVHSVGSVPLRPVPRPMFCCPVSVRYFSEHHALSCPLYVVRHRQRLVKVSSGLAAPVLSIGVRHHQRFRYEVSTSSHTGNLLEVETRCCLKWRQDV